ncbi:MAG TPA: RnfABCDGE type electron transport complex subunit B [Usitatibacter sp.]|nr:RnfABCDGE type electron transport complex subunit B [Usitatibacter sp.]
MTTPLARRIDAILPQTQCTRCGYDGCRPYAEAIADGRAGIDQCPPGGDEGLARLAALVGGGIKPLNPRFGVFAPPRLAAIDESACIGCTKCIQACPVDAIVGASKLMHTVIASWCTGCELCIPPCPVDCITLVPASALPAPTALRERYDARALRLARDAAEREAALEALE